MFRPAAATPGPPTIPASLRRLIPLLLLAGVATLLISDGCGHKGGRQAAEGEKGGAAAKPGILAIAAPTEPDHLLPPLSRSPAAAALWGWVYPALIRVEVDSTMRGRLVGDLATQWQLDPDRKGIRFYLATDRLWDDTTAVAPIDVVTSYRLFRDPAIGGGWARRLEEILSVEAIDASPSAVLFRFRRPLSQERALQLATLPLLSAAQWAKSAGLRPLLGEAGRIPRSAGPFRIDEWKQGDFIRLSRHPFPPPGRVPRADRVLIRFVPSGRGRMLQVGQGAVDAAIDIPPEEVQHLRDEGPEVRISWSGPIEVEALVWNCDHPLWGRWDLRRDVSAHIDMARLRLAAAGEWEESPILEATGLLEGAREDTTATPGSSDTTATSASTQEGAPTTDSLPDFSVAMYGNPSLEILYDAADPRRERIAVEIALQLDHFGVGTRLLPQSAAECAARIAGRRFDAVVIGYSIPAIRDVGEIWQTGGALNVAGLRAIGVDSLIALARSPAADSLPDVWDRVERRAHASFPFLPIDRRVRLDAIGPTVRGWRADPAEPYGDLLSLERSSR